MVYLTRRYHFSASHRLDSTSLTEAENQRVYGKCNRPHGHGHNYVLHVTVAGPVDPATGMVLDLAVFDHIVKEEVLDRMDHAYLNLDLEAFRQNVPTTENICIEIFNRLDRSLSNSNGARLKRILLEETPLNFFEYDGRPGAGVRDPKEPALPSGV